MWRRGYKSVMAPCPLFSTYLAAARYHHTFEEAWPSLGRGGSYTTTAAVARTGCEERGATEAHKAFLKSRRWYCVLSGLWFVVCGLGLERVNGCKLFKTMNKKRRVTTCLGVLRIEQAVGERRGAMLL